MPLTDLAVRNTKAAAQPIKLSDGGGLHLLIQPSGSKLWRLAYRFRGKQKTLALGSYPTVTLGQARAKRNEAKKLLVEAVDPSVQRKLDKAKGGTGNTFKDVANELLAKLEAEGARADHSQEKALATWSGVSHNRRPPDQ
jgi:hypothetical protein